MCAAAWRAALRAPPTTTEHVSNCLIKPATRATGGSYAATVLAGQCDPRDGTTPLVGVPTDFVSHAWRYKFADLVDALEAEAAEAEAAAAEAEEAAPEVVEVPPPTPKE